MIFKLFPNQANVYARGPVGENVLHVAMLLNTPSTLAIARYLIKVGAVWCGVRGWCEGVVRVGARR